MSSGTDTGSSRLFSEEQPAAISSVYIYETLKRETDEKERKSSAETKVEKGRDVCTIIHLSLSVCLLVCLVSVQP